MLHVALRHHRFNLMIRLLAKWQDIKQLTVSVIWYYASLATTYYVPTTIAISSFFIYNVSLLFLHASVAQTNYSPDSRFSNMLLYLLRLKFSPTE